MSEQVNTKILVIHCQFDTELQYFITTYEIIELEYMTESDVNIG